MHCRRLTLLFFVALTIGTFLGPALAVSATQTDVSDKTEKGTPGAAKATKPANAGKATETANATRTAKAAGGSITPEVETEFRTRLDAELASNATLRGAWLEVSVKPNRESFGIVPIFDEDHIQEQQAELERVLKRFLPNGKYELEPPKTRPVSKFVSDLQSLIENDLQLAGCLITGAYYKMPATATVDSPQELMLLGRIASIDKIGQIADKGIELKRKTEYAQSMASTNAKADEMKVVQPSDRVASYMFDYGVNSFIRGDYEEARKAFDLSILESPDRLEYMYWRVVTEIAQGDMERAYRHLRPLVAMRRDARYATSGGYSRVLRSLERVQGPVRQCLCKLERNAFFEGP